MILRIEHICCRARLDAEKTHYKMFAAKNGFQS